MIGQAVSRFILKCHADREYAIRSFAICSLFLSCLALVYSQLAFFPILSEFPELCFHSLMFAVPFVGVSLVLSLPQMTTCGIVLGIALFVHAKVMPLDYFEMSFQNPLGAILYSVVVALVAWACVRLANRARARRDLSAPFARRALPLAAALLLVSIVLSALTSPFVILGNASSLGVGDLSFDLITLFSFFLDGPPTVLQILFDWVLFVAIGLSADVLVTRSRSGSIVRSLRSVFQSWLLVVVVAAFLVTNTMTYCFETIQALRQADVLLENQVTYLESVVNDHVVREESLVQSEKQLVLGKASSVAQLIAHRQDVLQDQEALTNMCADLGLESITVCDGSGNVVADSEGSGIGTYNFKDSKETAKYLDLVDGRTQHIIESPRNSVSVDGLTNLVRVFAGVRRVDAQGFVQISIDAEEYSDNLSSVSLEGAVDSYSFGNEGMVLISKDEEIISTNSPSMGKTLTEAFNLNYYTEEMKEVLLADYYSGRTITLQDSETMGFLFLKAKRVDEYAVFAVISAEEIFASRTTTILINTMVYLVLFGAVFALAALLLDNVVVRSFNRTNGVLDLITQGDLDQRLNERTTVEFESLSQSVNTMVGALKESIREAEARFDRELSTAKAIQESALPSTFPPFPEIEAFDIFASMNAAKEVGGDFYDFFLIDDTTLGFLIADVSGKGIPASLFMMAAKTEIGNYMMTGIPLAEAIQSANHHLCQGNDAGMFVTVWAATFDWKTGKLTYVNAGHNPPLMRHDGTWEWLKKKSGLFLGTFETAKYRSHELMLTKGDEILLYTDGVNEAFSIDEEEYGNERLEAFLDEHVENHPRELVDELRQDVSRWSEGAEQSDDITMVALEYGVAPEVTASLEVKATLDQLEPVMSFIHDELGSRLCPIGTQNKIDIALEEMFVNVCHYAYADKSEPGTVRVSYVYKANPSSLTIELDDTGLPFDPLTRRDPTMPDKVEDVPIGGLGIMMTKRSVDDISYERDGDHNILVFTKRW